MFYLVKLTRSLDLHPKFFGPRLRQIINDKLVSEVEGTCNGRYGFIICVTTLADIGQGKIRDDGTGKASFEVSYNAIVFRPFKGEVIDCVVTSVNKMGFFAEAGPLQIFVSNHLIPDDYDYSTAGDAAYVSSDESVRIQEGTEVRLRIVGTRIDATEIFCIGTIKEDFLGVVHNPVA